MLPLHSVTGSSFTTASRPPDRLLARLALEHAIIRIHLSSLRKILAHLTSRLAHTSPTIFVFHCDPPSLLQQQRRRHQQSDTQRPAPTAFHIIFSLFALNLMPSQLSTTPPPRAIERRSITYTGYDSLRLPFSLLISRLTTTSPSLLH
jgi:hypothetical protein